MEMGPLERLAAASGVEVRRVHSLLTLLVDGEWWALADLVRETATSRRAVEALLRELRAERSGDRYRLTSENARSYREALEEDHRPFDPADPVGYLLPRHAELVERLSTIIAKGPRGLHALDHVAATPETVVRRALLLGAGFWPHDAHILCVGDHDLTSIAVAMMYPGAQVTVVDIDERILAYIDDQATRLGLTVRTRWADLRLGLPPSTRDSADLAITDPPYTADGVGLFVARAAEGLREPEHGRILLAYGASERTPMLARKVQSSLHDLNLAYEAIYPGFNRYHGAEAIGSASDLYVLRPTTKTRPAAEARGERFGAAIYTQGPQAVEAGPDKPAQMVESPADLLVGAWPRDVLPKVPRTRLATWLAKPHATNPRHVVIAVPAGLEAVLPRLLLAARADRVRLVLAEPAKGMKDLVEALATVYEITAADLTIDAVRRTLPHADDERVLRMILDRAHGKLANTWRDALIKADPTLTKRGAQAVIARIAPWAAGVTPLELPLHRLLGLRDAVRTSLGEDA